MLACTKVGSGATHIVMLHDWFCDHTSYDFCLPFCDQDKFTFHFLDLRGYGDSKDLGGPYTLDQAYQDVHDYMAATFKMPVHLVGHSMSTLIVQKFLEKDESMLKSATLVGPVPAFGMDMAEDIMAFMKDISASNDEGARVAIGMMTGDRLHAQWADFKVKKWRETSVEEARLAYLDMFVSADFAESLQANTSQDVPILLVVGKYDMAVHQALAMKDSLLKWFPKATLIEVENSGHYPMQETPPFFTAILHKFHSDIGATC